MYYKSVQNFHIVSKLIFIKSTSQSVLTLLLVILVGYEGLYIGILLSLIIEVYFGRHSFKNIQLIFNIKKFIHLIKIGFPILLVGVVWSLMIASDRLIISLLMSPEDVGNYGVGMLIFSTMMLIPQVVGQVLYPKIVENVSLNKYKEIKKYYLQVNKILAIFMGLVVFIGTFHYRF
ncbi:lipopolysaccharide biosynthesis protein [Cytobacillus oceanisediminis]|uniref:lipopolysaccharide biosynthesis protein n=1 Tax=Cytobacillus oceanisediminis TaxID=665099 RepID=UPI001FB52D50|nr:oligosaccharide flippase family protein [Cytobacillus oceanisediminis]UOE55163.1 oligosaccharide flippase family protein [Cytobacillus oceanisediminis]